MDLTKEELLVAAERAKVYPRGNGFAYIANMSLDYYEIGDFLIKNPNREPDG